MLNRSAAAMAAMIRNREISSVELVKAHLQQIEKIDSRLNAVVCSMREAGLRDAAAADAKQSRGEACGPLHGVPFSVKDSIEVAGTPCTAGTLGLKGARPSANDATLVSRLRGAGGIPLMKTNLPDLLFSFETDNLVFGRTNNPYDLSRTPGGSSGGESALIAACGSPLGLGSDCLGSVRIPAAFCGIASIKPTGGRLPRTGHVPPLGGWVEKLWQIGPMARWIEDVMLAMKVLAGEDVADFTSLPVPLMAAKDTRELRIAFFTDNGIAKCSSAVADAVRSCADRLSKLGMHVEEKRPPGVDQSYELEMSILGADGAEGIDEYLKAIGSSRVHPLLTGFVNRFRPYRASAAEFAQRWSQWDEFRLAMARFFGQYDAVLCPVYTQTALKHGASDHPGNFEAFSYTMTWNLAGYPAATVRSGESAGLPVNVQVVAKPWREMTALAICRIIEQEGGGWKAPRPLN